MDGRLVVETGSLGGCRLIAAVVVAMVVGRVARNSSAGQNAAAARQAAVEPRAEQAPVAPTTSAPPSAQTRLATTTTGRAGRWITVNARQAARATEVEVLVPRDQRQAVGRLFASLAGRPEVVSALLKFNGGGAVGSTVAGSTVTEPAELTIAPIRIEPVVVPALPSSAPVLDK